MERYWHRLKLCLPTIVRVRLVGLSQFRSSPMRSALSLGAAHPQLAAAWPSNQPVEDAPVQNTQCQLHLGIEDWCNVVQPKALHSVPVEVQVQHTTLFNTGWSYVSAGAAGRLRNGATHSLPLTRPCAI